MRVLQRSLRGLLGFRSTSCLRRGADSLLFRGHYRLIGPAALIVQRSRRGFDISVQVRSPSRAGLGTPAVVNTHCSVAATMEAILRVFGKNRQEGRMPAARTDGPGNFAPG